ncbi:hypothetical protein GCM10020331_032780 [Ectobacillus funiculus]
MSNLAKKKMLRGLIKACEKKRPVSLKQLEDVTQHVERELRNIGVSEVESDKVGEMVMEALRDIDEVAYVRFASVYRQFKDLNVFIEELKDILQKKAGSKKSLRHKCYRLFFIRINIQ